MTSTDQPTTPEPYAAFDEDDMRAERDYDDRVDDDPDED